MASSLRELIVSVSADTTKYQREMDRASRMGGQYFRSVQQGGAEASRSWDRQTAAARTHATAIEASSQAITRYMGVAAGALGAGALIGMADQWTNISARVKLATDSTAEYEAVQRRLKDIANTTYRSYAEAADQFSSTSRIMRELGFSTNDTLDSAEALGLALVAGGADAQRGASALDAWTKSMAAGRIGTDQWQTILMQTPRVAQAVADGLGKTTLEVTKMAREGQLLAGVAVPAITSQMAKLRGEVADMPTEFRDAMGRVNNELLTFVGGMNETYDATGNLVKGLEYLVDNIDVVSKVAGGAAIGVLASKMILMAKATAQSVQASIQSRAAMVAEAVAIRDATLMAQQKAQSDLRRAQAAMTAARGTAESARQSRNLAAARLIERQATQAAAQAEVAMGRALSTTAVAKRAAIGLLGGPGGLALSVGAVAATWLLFRDNSTEATQALRDMTGPLDEVLAKYKELGSAQQRQAMRDAREEIDEAAEAMQEAVRKMSQNVGGTGVGAVFREIDEQVRAGTITVEEGSRRISAALDTYLAQRGRGEGMKNLLIDLAANWESNAQKAERAGERVDGYNKANAATAPGAAAAASGLRDQASGYRELGEEAQKALQKMQDQAQNVRGQIERLGKSAREVATLDVRDEFRRMQRSGEIDFNNRDDPNVQRVIAAGSALINNRDELASAQRRLADSTRNAASARRAANKEESDAEKAAARLIEQYDDLIASQMREIALHGEIGRAAAMAYDTATGALRGFSEAQKAALNEGAAWLDWLDEMAAFDSATDEISASYKKTTDKMSTYADQAARNMQSALGDSLYSVLDGKFSDIGDSFSNMLKRMVAELAASRMWEVLGGAMAGYTGQGGWGNLIRGMGGAMQTDGKRAGGGEVRPFSAYDVTEHGPELLQMGGRQILMTGAQGGVVSPLMNKAGGGASGARAPMQVVVHNHVGGKVEAREERQQQPDGSSIDRLVLSIVGDSMFNGGQLGGGMERTFGLRRAI